MFGIQPLDSSLVNLLNSGYNDPSTETNWWSYTPEGGTTPSTTTATPIVISPVYVKSTVTVTTTVPQTTVQPVYSQYTIAQLASHGWNTHARSVSPIAIGQYIKFTCAGGIVGACLSLGQANQDGRGIHTYAHNLIIDNEGIRVYEAGRFMERMRTLNSPVTALRIYRHINNSVAYVATTGQETLVHTSITPSPFPAFLPVYVYGHLYASGDKVTSAVFQIGEVQYGRV